MIRNVLKILLLRVCTIYAYITGERKKPIVLMYHSFDDVGWRHGVSPKKLEQQLVYVSKNRNIVPLNDIAAYARKEKEIPGNAVAVTVDDGYEDTYTILFPLAKKYNIPFTIFLTTDLVPMEKLGNLNRPTWEQLQEMVHSRLVEIAVHGHSHINFPEVLRQGIQTLEIQHSSELLQEKLGVVTDTIAYPSGEHDKLVCEYLTEMGYEAAYTTHMGAVHPGDDPLLLNRIVVDRCTSFGLFKARLSVGLEIYTRTVHKIKKIYA